MNKHRLKQRLLTLLGMTSTLALTLLLILCGVEEAVPEPETSFSVHDTYTLEPARDGRLRFTNLVDGYTITVPDDFTVDMDNSAVRAVLGNERWKLEIYRQKLGADTSVAGYINYSKRFLENTVDHRPEQDFSLTVKGCKAYVAQWSRRDLPAIANDFNHYACVDVVTGKREVYTFLFKSDAAFADSEQYLELVETFATTAVARTPYTTKTQGPGPRQQWDPLTRQVYEELFAPEAELTWGIFEYTAPLTMERLEVIEQELEHEFAVLLVYAHFGETNIEANLAQSLANAKAHGRMLELTLQTYSRPAIEGNMVYDILAGEYDDFLQRLAELIADNRQPVLFRLGNEMNGDWCSYCAWSTSRDTDIFQAFYRYVYDRLEEHGAGPWLISVWNPNERSFPKFKWNDASLYYPWADDVDVIGLTGYNTGTYYAGESWRSFDEIYAPLYKAALERYAQPLMITEFSCSSIGGDKAQWVHDMFVSLPHYPQIKVAVWWNGRDMAADGITEARPYWIDRPPLMSDYMKNNLSGAKTDWLNASAPHQP